MPNFYIMPKQAIADTVSAKSGDDAMIAFAANMDSDMNTYFQAVGKDAPLEIVKDNEYGTIYNTMSPFNIYCLRKTPYKDGTYKWKIGFELKADPNKYLIVDDIRGSKEDAQNLCKKWILGENRS